MGREVGCSGGEMAAWELTHKSALSHLRTQKCSQKPHAKTSLKKGKPSTQHKHNGMWKVHPKERKCSYLLATTEKKVCRDKPFFTLLRNS